MNNELAAFAREQIKNGLKLLPESSVLLFKRMYSPKNLEVSIDEVVDSMPKCKLDWAMQQVQRTIDKIRELRDESL